VTPWWPPRWRTTLGYLAAVIGFLLMAVSWLAAVVYGHPEMLWLFLAYGSALVIGSWRARWRPRAPAASETP